MKKTDEKTPVAEDVKVEENELAATDADTSTEQTEESFWVKTGRAIWNGAKWICKKTWKFATGAGAAVATMAIMDHFHNDDAEEEHPEEDEADPE